MGGVDLLDSLVSLYKQKMKSRRWYMYIFWHTILIAAVNAWLWYKPHCSLLHRKPMKLCNFIRDVASGLIEFKSKVGRPAGLSQQPMVCHHNHLFPLWMRVRTAQTTFLYGMQNVNVANTSTVKDSPMSNALNAMLIFV